MCLALAAAAAVPSCGDCECSAVGAVARKGSRKYELMGAQQQYWNRGVLGPRASCVPVHLATHEVGSTKRHIFSRTSYIQRTRYSTEVSVTAVYSQLRRIFFPNAAEPPHTYIPIIPHPARPVACMYLTNTNPHHVRVRMAYMTRTPSIEEGCSHE